MPSTREFQSSTTICHRQFEIIEVDQNFLLMHSFMCARAQFYVHNLPPNRMSVTARHDETRF